MQYFKCLHPFNSLAEVMEWFWICWNWF